MAWGTDVVMEAMWSTHHWKNQSRCVKLLLDVHGELGIDNGDKLLGQRLTLPGLE